MAKVEKFDSHVGLNPPSYRPLIRSIVLRSGTNEIMVSNPVLNTMTEIPGSIVKLEVM